MLTILNHKKQSGFLSLQTKHQITSQLYAKNIILTPLKQKFTIQATMRGLTKTMKKLYNSNKVFLPNLNFNQTKKYHSYIGLPNCTKLLRLSDLLLQVVTVQYNLSQSKLVTVLKPYLISFVAIRSFNLKNLRLIDIQSFIIVVQ